MLLGNSLPTYARRGNKPASPLDRPNLAVWWDAADPNARTVNGSNLVAQWSDKSGNGNHAVQATDLRKPLLLPTGMNGKPSFHFRHDGSNGSGLVAPDSASLVTPTISIFQVLKRRAGLGVNQYVLWKTSPNPNYEWETRIHSTDQLLATFSINGAGAGAFPLKTGTIALDVPFIAEAHHDGTNCFVGLNGSLNSASALAGTLFNGTNALSIGSTYSFSEPYMGEASEILITNAVTSSANRIWYLQYLSAKWGITI